MNEGLQILTLDAYQLAASETADYPQATDREALTYLIVGLCGEAGELANKWKKHLRGDYGLTDEMKDKLIEESGDCLWYLSEISRKLKRLLSQTANQNIHKLSYRKATGTIKGNGDGLRGLVCPKCLGVGGFTRMASDGTGRTTICDRCHGIGRIGE